jgi:hypothetical protein
MLTTSLPSTTTPRISTVRAIAIILAHGVVRLHQRKKELDNRTQQSVHDCVLVTKEKMQ